MPTATHQRRYLIGQEALRNIFKARGIVTAKELASRTKLSYGVAYRAMNGAFSPNTRSILAKVLGIPEKEMGTPSLSDRGTKSITPQTSQESGNAEQDVGSRAVEDSLTEGQKQLLLEALFKTRKASGFTKDEAAAVLDHVEDITKRFNDIQMEKEAVSEVLAGKRFLDVVEGKVVILAPSEPGLGNSGTSFASPVPVKDLIERYILEGADKAKWKPYYVSEKRNVLGIWIKALGLRGVTDITLVGFNRAVREMHKDGKSNGTIEKYAHALEAFCDWLRQRGDMPANPIEGMAAGSKIKKLFK